MGICRWEWFGLRRLPFEDTFLNRRSSRSRSSSSSSRRKQCLQQQEKHVARIITKIIIAKIITKITKIIIFYGFQKLH